MLRFVLSLLAQFRLIARQLLLDFALLVLRHAVTGGGRSYAIYSSQQQADNKRQHRTYGGEISFGHDKVKQRYILYNRVFKLVKIKKPRLEAAAKKEHQSRRRGRRLNLS